MIDIDALTAPLADDAPCGPDLEAEGDIQAMTLLARLEGELPASFFSFDRASIDFKVEAASLKGLLARSLDVRPVVFLAKLAILNRDLDGFSDWLAALAALLARHWSDLHPAVANGQGSIRGAVVQTLDDMPTVVLPLQYAPLISSRRIGAVSFRTYLAAAGEVARREGEPEVDAAAVEQAFASAETGELEPLRDTLTRMADSVAAIRRTWLAEGGFEHAPTLERLGKLSDRMLGLVTAELSRRMPQDVAVPELEAVDAPAESDRGTGRSETQPSDRIAPRIGTARVAAYALAAIAHHLGVNEPSNPALHLVMQAQRLVGRSFADIVQFVMPDAFEDVRIRVGADPAFVFRLDRLPEVEAPPEPDGDEPFELPELVLRSRRDVQALLDEVAAFYKVAEPANPIPLLCDRARALCNLDFLALMRDMMRRD